MSQLSYRPNGSRIYISLCAGNNWSRLDVKYDDGAVHIDCLAGNNGWASLDKIIFVPEDETLTYVAGGVGFQNGWVNFGGEYEGISYYKDDQGNVFLSGLAKNGTIAGTMFTLPVGFRPQSDLALFGCNCSSVYSRCDVYSVASAPAVPGDVYVCDGANGHYSLDGIRFPTSASWIAPSYQNSWVNYSDSWGPPGYWKDGNGLVWLRGMVKNGGIAQSCFTLPVGYRPPKRILLSAISNGHPLTRLDIETDGRVIPQAGYNGWFSLWGCCFYAASAQSNQIPYLKPNWVTYGPDPAYMKEEAKIRTNKLIDIYGMVMNGTEPGDIFYLPEAITDTTSILGMYQRVP